MRSELDLEEFAADSGALAVCAYPRGDGSAAAPEHAGCVHPHHLGSRPASPAFQAYRTGKDGWTVNGVVDADGAPAFAAIPRTLLE
ncbi:hypothetical protein ABT187_49010 [Streptomyces sp. NPDC001817]|uniref:hypothetical protein n=1 Tax=Streptomyces sp. NPDC001817 TaxID=3154398 RepID=UPI00331ED30A